jgi:hypothetical protein
LTKVIVGHYSSRLFANPKGNRLTVVIIEAQSVRKFVKYVMPFIGLLAFAFRNATA